MENNILITFFESNIYIFLLIIPFISQLGIPVGAMFFILLAGTFINSFTQLIIFFIIILFSTVSGDFVSYFIARKFSDSSFFKYLINKEKINNLYKKAVVFFKKYGAISIFLSRFLITGFGPTLNYIIGFQSFSFKKFGWYVIFGEILYGLELLILGYIFKDTFEDIVSIISNFGLALILGFILYQMTKIYLKNKHREHIDI